MKPPVLIDVDGVLANLTASVLDLARTVAGIYDKVEADVVHWEYEKSIGWPALWHVVGERVNTHELCYRLPEYPGAIAWLRELEREHGEENVLICTSPFNAAWASQRVAWLEKRGVKLSRQIHCSAKHLVSGFLVDDRAGVHAKRAPGATFCLNRPWNASAVEPVRGGYEEASAWLRGLRGL